MHSSIYKLIKGKYNKETAAEIAAVFFYPGQYSIPLRAGKPFS